MVSLVAEIGGISFPNSAMSSVTRRTIFESECDVNELIRYTDSLYQSRCFWRARFARFLTIRDNQWLTTCKAVLVYTVSVRIKIS